MLAQYANSGVKVYYVCSIRGEAGNVDLECLKGVPFNEITFTKDYFVKCKDYGRGVQGELTPQYAY